MTTKAPETIPEFVAALADDGNVAKFMSQQICCNGQDCGCQGATVQSYLEWIARDLHAAVVAERDALLDVAIDVAVSLAAAISLLERGGKSAKKAAPSDKMFDQMLRDYRASLAKARAALAKQESKE